VSYDPNSRNFPVDEGVLASIRSQTGTDTPYIQADWFFSHAARPPLYYDLLGVPANLQQLQAQLDFDLGADITEQQVARAGFTDSGPSHYNRVIERHALSNHRGVVWLTYDFDAGSGFSDILTHPLDFRQTSSELLFSLPNGLHAYMSLDAQGGRIDKAPTAAVQDARSSDLAIEPSLSCINCHAQTGVIARHDQVRQATILTTTDVAMTNAVLALYKDDATIDALFAEDRTRYQTALSALKMQAFTEGSPHDLDDGFSSLLSSRDVAGVLGIQEQQLFDVINASPGVFSPEVLALRVATNKIPRDAFESQFAALVSALGLGVPDHE
jgi:serine/threonine-protein kinase